MTQVSQSWRRTAVLTGVVLGVTWAPGKAQTLLPSTYGQFFTSPGIQKNLQWEVSGTATSIQCEVRNYLDQVVQSQSVSVVSGLATLSVNLPPGYYEIIAGPTSQRFGLVVASPYAGTPDAFFGMDCALSWLQLNAPARTELVAALKRSGIGIARERVSWGAINPTAMTWNWQASPNNYESLRQEYANNQVKLLDVFHSAPSWTGTISGNPYPQNLSLTKSAWQTIGNRWTNTIPAWKALEVWNEPDLSGSGADLPADQYLPVVKTVGYGFQQNGLTTTVGGGVFGDYNRAFVQQAVNNGFLNAVDFVSFHTYAKAPAIQNLVSSYRTALKPADGSAELPLWLTESGWSWTKGTVRPNNTEDKASALEISMKVAESRACGIARVFPFVYPFYDEGTRNFGMMGQEITPLRSMGAYVQSVAALSGYSYGGDLALSGIPSIQRARVFTSGTNAIVVLYTGVVNSGAAPIQLPISASSITSIQGIDGRAVTKAADGSFPITDGIVYVRTTTTALSGVAGLYQTNTTAKQLYTTGQNARVLRPAAAPMVMQAVMPTSAKPSKRGYQVDAMALTSFPFKVRVTNLSSAALTATLAGTLTGSAAYSATLSNINVSNLAAGASTEVTWNLDLKTPLDLQHQESVTVKITGTQSNGVVMSPVSVLLTRECSLDEYFELYPNSERLNITDLARWTPNWPATATASMTVGNSNWLLTTNFGTGDRWAYPRFTPHSLAGFPSSQGLLIRGKTSQPATVRIMVTEATGGGTYYTAFAAFPADNQWHTALIRWQDFAALPSSAQADANGKLDLNQIVSLQLGLNSNTTTNTLEVSHLYLAKGTPVDTLDEYLQLYPQSQQLNITDLTRWTPNVSGIGTMSMSVNASNNWLLNASFGTGDRWVYPKFTPHSLTGFPASQGLLFRAKASQAGTVRIMAVEQGGGTSYTAFAAIPADNQWHSTSLRWRNFTALPGTTDANGQLDLDQIVRLQVGMNSSAATNSLEVSGLYLQSGSATPNP